MAVRKPIVITNGEFEQLQAGDTLFSTDVKELTNDNANAITIGQPVYISGVGSVDLAQANAAATKNVVGLVGDASIPSGNAGAVQVDGTLASANWTAVTGSANLTPGAAYYLDAANPGKLTETAPSTGYVGRVARGINLTEIEIEIEPTIKM